MTEERSVNKKEHTIGNPLFAALLFLASVLSVGAVCMIKGFGGEVLLRNVVLTGMGCFAVLYIFVQTRLADGFAYDNGRHAGRFLFAYLLCLALAAACAFLPPAGWPYLAVFLVLSLFSNALVGVSAGALLLLISVLLSECGVSMFVLYFVCGLIAAFVFRELDDTYRIVIPLVISLLFLFTGETACVVLFANETLKLPLFMIPFVNVIVSYFLMIVILKFFSALVIFQYRDKYMEINDPECALLVELKNMSKDEYYHAVHTAYFCDRIARRLSLDADALKAGGYYHRIGLLRGESNWENAKLTAEEYGFPPAVQALLKEYLDKDAPMRKKETLVLVMSDAVVSSIRFLFGRNKEGKLDYDQIIETVFKKKLELPGLSDSDITLREISLMKKIFKEEKLYYDFLR